MNIIKVNEVEGEVPESFIALGNFDGLHLAHLALIKKVVAEAEKHHVLSGVLIFMTHTKNIIFGEEQELLTSRTQKYKLLNDLGVDIIYEMDFTEDVMKLSPEDFFEKLLLEKLNVRGVVVGFDYRFGHKAKGNVKLLERFSRDKDIFLSVIPPIIDREHIISSTKIREFIRNGEIEKANEMLGHPFSIRGEVIHGKKLGTKMGYPTANIKPEVNYIIPKFGVYDTDIIIKGKRYRAATSVGTNPTLDETGVKIEANILNFDEMIYGEIVELEFLHFLRDEINFPSIDALFKQIKKDSKAVEKR